MTKRRYRSLGQVLRLEGVPAGDHTVRIGGLADNCMVAGSDRTTVAVRGDDTVTVEFRRDLRRGERANRR